MKRSLFYLLLAVQLIVIIFLTVQFEKIDDEGKMIRIQTVKPEYPMYDSTFHDDIYVEYEINRISKEKWNAYETLEYKERVYVLLKSDENGIYHVDNVSTDRLTEHGEDEIVLSGAYHYTDEKLNYHYVDYGMGKIEHVQQFGQFQDNDQLMVTVLIGKWNQYKITAVETVE